MVAKKKAKKKTVKKPAKKKSKAALKVVKSLPVVEIKQTLTVAIEPYHITLNRKQAEAALLMLEWAIWKHPFATDDYANETIALLDFLYEVTPFNKPVIFNVPTKPFRANKDEPVELDIGLEEEFDAFY